LYGRGAAVTSAGAAGKTPNGELKMTIPGVPAPCRNRLEFSKLATALLAPQRKAEINIGELDK